MDNMAQSSGALTFTALLGLFAPAFAADASLLKPPHGTQVAIVVFQDLECSECARAYPLVQEIAKAHNVPVVLHDFPLPRHTWSFEAAIWARYFDQSSVALGNAFREFILTNQAQISHDNLQQWIQKFGDTNKVSIPSDKDPTGKLAEKVRADYALGQRIGVERTPTIWIVSRTEVSQPFVEDVKDQEQLGQTVGQMLQKAQAAESATPSPKQAAPGKHKQKSQKKQDDK
jgi:protein-disulfide isomerase